MPGLAGSGFFSFNFSGMGNGTTKLFSFLQWDIALLGFGGYDTYEG
jgi:hypothetical protein